MHILLVRYHLHFPTVHSLKEKRSILKRILHALRSEYNISVAEIGHHDTWQRCDLAVIGCSALRDPLERMERAVSEQLEGDPEAQVAEWQTEWL